MKIKTIPEDFVVNEIFDYGSLKKKDEGKGDIYYYFKLIKKDYAQMRALDVVKRIFNVSKNMVHFAGNKDKMGVTSQVISIFGLRDGQFEKNLDFFNEKFEDLNIEFIGKFKGRVNLGDNLGNSFEIVVRDLSEEEIEVALKNKDNIAQRGVLNFFDEQRFGYANNSHIVGKFILKNDLRSAVLEVLTSLPENPSEDLALFVSFVKENFDEFALQNVEVLEKAISLAPKFLRDEVLMLEHLKRAKNDFPGAFRRIHKKLRTMYFNAYQSYLFNETIRILDERGIIDNYETIALTNFDAKFDSVIEKITFDLLDRDGVTLDMFKLPSSPELRVVGVSRDVRIGVESLIVSDKEIDELFEGKFKVKVCFELKKGAYATNVVKQLFS